MSRSLLITGLSWREGTPRLRVREPPSTPSTLVDLAGLDLNYRADASTTRRCLGHKPFRESAVAWRDCDNPPLHDGRLCDRCAASDATFASQLHHAHARAPGELDPAVLDHLRKPNKLYLAAFLDGSVKVGTSTAPRLNERLDEQGAWRARVVADADDGFAVRAIEDRVSLELGLPQAISIRRKLAGLHQPRPPEVLLDELDLWAGRIHDLLERFPNSGVRPANDDWTFAGADDDIYRRLHPYPAKLETGAHHIVCRAASGRAAVVERPATGDRFVVDIRSLFGLELAMGDFESDPLAVQDSLF